MKRFLVISLAGIFMVMCLVSITLAASQEEAKAMVEKAAEFYKANGKDKAMAAFNDPKGQFVQGELYIIAYDFEGKVLANATSTKLIGKNIINMKDPDGKPFMKELLETAKKGSGWIEYKFNDPKTNKIRPKVTYVQKVDSNVAIGCGIYK
ncbi:MAG: Cache domain protein [Syntrophorhabdus sp. PtaU1.Bin058]|nr:MAG: Cache domain protein [Syntrophorhabdus sp. PtaU1.Bin058]